MNLKILVTIIFNRKYLPDTTATKRWKRNEIKTLNYKTPNNAI